MPSEPSAEERAKTLLEPLLNPVPNLPYHRITTDELLERTIAAIQSAERDKANETWEELKPLEWALENMKWKSTDKDNMEFECRTTCFVKDKIDAFLRKRAGD